MTPKSRLINPLELLEEARKGWDYFISDEIVHAAEIFNGEVVWPQKGYIEDYIKGHLWFEVVAHRIRDEKQKLAWLIESCPHELFFSNEPESHVPTGTSDNPMLIFISQLPENAKKFQFRPLRSVVGLKSLDGIVRRRQKKFTGIRGQPINQTLVLLRYIEGERYLTFLSLSQSAPLVGSVFHRQSPSNVFERSDEVTQNISDNQPPIFPNVRVNSHLVNTSALSNDVRGTVRRIQFALSAEGDFWIARGATDRGIEATDVYIRPFNLELGAIKWMHLLSSTDDEV